MNKDDGWNLVIGAGGEDNGRELGGRTQISAIW
jgi:hypothetical protein